MLKFVFIREPKKLKPKDYNISEPVIIYDEHQINYFKFWIITITIIISIRYIWWVIKPEKQELIEPQTYTKCYQRGDVKYYDKLLDKVLIRPWYNYCERSLTEWTWSLEGSCVDTGCNMWINLQVEDEEWSKLVGKRYFIR